MCCREFGPAVVQGLGEFLDSRLMFGDEAIPRETLDA